MPKPNDAPYFPAGIALNSAANGQYILPQPLIDLLHEARNGYDWPAGTGAAQSQQTILNLEATVRAHLANLTPSNALALVVALSRWAGNNATAHAQIVGATPAQQVRMQTAITCLINPGRECTGIDVLCTLPGIRLVIASKIFRFCSPNHGAAVDRHVSYFFNSLQIVGEGAATHFVREWATASTKLQGSPYTTKSTTHIIRPNISRITCQLSTAWHKQ